VSGLHPSLYSYCEEGTVQDELTLTLEYADVTQSFTGLTYSRLNIVTVAALVRAGAVKNPREIDDDAR
jgi:hypothetical protein